MKTSKKHLQIKLDNVSFKYSENYALKDINLEINKGDFVYIIGPNGAGKTTLVRLMTNLLVPSSGSIVFKGNSVGFLPQILNQKPNFPITVREVIYSGFAKQKLIISKDDSQKIEQWLDKMGLNGFANRSMSSLSGGQQQRVFLIRAMISKPEVLILDEPTSALDPQFRAQFNSFIQEVNDKGTTVIYVTHDLHSAENENSLIIFVDQTIEFFGNIKEYKHKEHTH